MSQCAITFTANGADGTPKDGALFYVRIKDGPVGQTFNGSPQTVRSSGTNSNNTTFDVPQGCVCGIKRGNNGEEQQFTAPAASSAQLADLMNTASLIGEDATSP